jgi:uncharacterized protein (UPF0548 family)
MSLGGVRFGRLEESLRDQLLASAGEATPTYDHVGSTLDPERRSAAGVRARHLDLGRGDTAFSEARTAVRTWVPHSGIGATVEPAGQAVELDATVLVVLRFGPFYLVAPNRVVAVIDEPRRFAFAYGTLPTHPESGEESFTVEQRADGTVRATICVQATPATLAARAAGPAGRWLQGVALRRYLRAIHRHVTSKAA